MEKISILTAIRNRIREAQFGSVFVAVDFVNITDKMNVNAYLSLLTSEGVLHRVLRGVYYKPQYNELLNEYILPDTDKVAQAIARNYGWTIIPSGDTALNMLGLSTQVPALYGYVCDGAYKEYKVNNTTIQFKRTTNRVLSKLSYKTALVVQALKTLGKEYIDDAVISHLRHILSAEEKSKMLNKAKTVTAWIYDCFKKICFDE